MKDDKRFMKKLELGQSMPLLEKIFYDEWKMYRESYIRSASMLPQSIINEDEKHFDCKTITVIFCFRHYVKLSIKSLVNIINGYIDTDISFDNEHHLSKLFKNKLLDSPGFMS